MAYDLALANRVRAYLAEVPGIDIQEKEMFGTLNFMVNGKTCVCVLGHKLMLRFDPAVQASLYDRKGYETMYMKGKPYKGYCYMYPEGFELPSDFAFYMDLCLAYNSTAKASKRR